MVRGEDREFGVAAQADRTSGHGSTTGCGEDNGRDLDGSCGRCQVWRFSHTAWHYFDDPQRGGARGVALFDRGDAALLHVGDPQEAGTAAIAAKDKGRSKTKVCGSSPDAGAGVPSTAI